MAEKKNLFYCFYDDLCFLAHNYKYYKIERVSDEEILVNVLEKEYFRNNYILYHIILPLLDVDSLVVLRIEYAEPDEFLYFIKRTDDDGNYYKGVIRVVKAWEDKKFKVDVK